MDGFWIFFFFSFASSFCISSWKVLWEEYENDCTVFQHFLIARPYRISRYVYANTCRTRLNGYRLNVLKLQNRLRFFRAAAHKILVNWLILHFAKLRLTVVNSNKNIALRLITNKSRNRKQYFIGFRSLEVFAILQTQCLSVFEFSCRLVFFFK